MTAADLWRQVSAEKLLSGFQFLLYAFELRYFLDFVSHYDTVNFLYVVVEDCVHGKLMVHLVLHVDLGGSYWDGVNVQVGSGLTDVLREQIWKDKELFIGRIIEVRYQEVTPDGSLRFPTFVCFRNDRG